MKKKLAMLMALSLTMTSLGTITASAAAETADTEVTATANATVEAVNDTVYKIVLPTTKALDYIIDPQGVATLESGEASLDDLEGGNVYAKTKVAIANKSSKDVVVTASVSVVEDTTKPINVVADVNANGITDPSVALALVPTEATFAVVTDDSATHTDGTGESAIKYKATVSNQSTTGYVLNTTSAVAVPVVLAKAEYVVKKDAAGTASYAIKENSIGGAVAFAIAGKCSEVGDWKAAGLTAPTITVTYKFEKATDAQSDMLVKPVTPAEVTALTSYVTVAGGATVAATVGTDGDLDTNHFVDPDGSVLGDVSDTEYAENDVITYTSVVKEAVTESAMYAVDGGTLTTVTSVPVDIDAAAGDASTSAAPELNANDVLNYDPDNNIVVKVSDAASITSLTFKYNSRNYTVVSDDYTFNTTTNELTINKDWTGAGVGYLSTLKQQSSPVPFTLTYSDGTTSKNIAFKINYVVS